MAKKKAAKPQNTKRHMSTSIGRSKHTKIKNKQQRRLRKAKYRGQGR